MTDVEWSMIYLDKTASVMPDRLSQKFYLLDGLEFKFFEYLSNSFFFFFFFSIFFSSIFWFVAWIYASLYAEICFWSSRLCLLQSNELLIIFCIIAIYFCCSFINMVLGVGQALLPRGGTVPCADMISLYWLRTGFSYRYLYCSSVTLDLFSGPGVLFLRLRLFFYWLFLTDELRSKVLNVDPRGIFCISIC